MSQPLKYCVSIYYEYQLCICHLIVYMIDQRSNMIVKHFEHLRIAWRLSYGVILAIGPAVAHINVTAILTAMAKALMWTETIYPSLP